MGKLCLKFEAALFTPDLFISYPDFSPATQYRYHDNFYCSPREASCLALRLPVPISSSVQTLWYGLTGWFRGRYQAPRKGKGASSHVLE